MEIWDIYDKDRCKTGETIERGKIPSGQYHLVVYVCIFNSKNEMLIQQRQSFKKGSPNIWDLTVGGSAIAGENSQAAAERELFEEIGYRLDLTNIRPHLTINFPISFVDYYLVEKDIDIEKLNLQYEEVQNVKWATREEILRMIENKKFIPYYTGFIQLLFDMRKRYGAHI